MDRLDTTQQHRPMQNNEIDFSGLWKVLVKYKILILVFTTLTTLGSVYYIATMPTTYKVKVLMLPSVDNVGNSTINSKLSGLANIAGISLAGKMGGSGNIGEETLVRLQTRSFLKRYVNKKNLKPDMFPEKWNKLEKKWIDTEPTDREAAELFNEMIYIDADPMDRSGKVVFYLEWENPVHIDKISDVANGVIDEVNFQAKNRALVEAKNSILFLKKELEQTSILSSQYVLYAMIEQQIQKIMLANVRKDFVFKVIDPAVIPNTPEKKPYLIILISMMLGFLFGFAISIGISHFKRAIS